MPVEFGLLALLEAKPDKGAELASPASRYDVRSEKPRTTFA